METFLSEVARRLREEHPHNLDQVTVIFNNRRSGLFLRRQFASMEGQPFFLPRIIGIDELVSEIGNLTIVPNEYLLFELFDIHRTLATSEDKYSCFEDFISFGDMMLSDFSEIDLYCVDAQQLAVIDHLRKIHRYLDKQVYSLYKTDPYRYLDGSGQSPAAEVPDGDLEWPQCSGQCGGHPGTLPEFHV